MARLLARLGQVTVKDAGPPGDTAAGAVAAGDTDTGARAAWPARRRWLLLVAAGWLLQAGLRAWLSRAQVVPLANPDESAYLLAARVLAGGVPANLSGSTLYQGGYPLLLTPVFWFTHNPVTAYHAVLMVNAAVSALAMPLGYAACRRLGLGRPAAWCAAMAAALLPAGLFFSEYAMSDAVFPVITLAWLVTAHGWLTAASTRGRYAAAVGSALLAGYALAAHPRGRVIVACYVAFGVLVAARRLVPRGTVAAAAAALAAACGAGWALDRHLATVLYPQGTRSLSGEMIARLRSVSGIAHVLEMAVGQMWRLSLDSWGIAGIGLAAAVAVAVGGSLRGPAARMVPSRGWPARMLARQDEARPGASADLRIMAALAAAVTVIIACAAPAALPGDAAQAWASGRYLDGMIIVFFLAGAAVLLRERARRICWYAACAAGCTAAAGVIVAFYAGASLPVTGFGAAFVFGEPAVLTQDWTQASVAVATAVVLGLLAASVALALAARRWGSGARPAAGRYHGGVIAAAAGTAAMAAVSLVADAQLTSHVSQANTPAQAASTTGFVAASGLRPGEQVAISPGIGWQLAIPQEFEIWWAQPETFSPPGPPPSGVTVVEVPWQSGQPARASWPQAPAGWRIVASNSAGGWVAWRQG